MFHLNTNFDNASIENKLPDSQIYIEKLERKLLKLKGKNKDLKAKDMLAVMKDVRDDQMTHLNSANEESTFLPDVDGKEINNSYVERRLFPQKNALTSEELQRLLEADVLAKQSADSTPDLQQEKSVDR